MEENFNEYKGLEKFNDLVDKISKGASIIVIEENKEFILTFELNEPAQIEDIKEINNKLDNDLPDPFTQFLLKFNGGRIYNYKNIDGYNILGTKDLLSTNESVSKVYEEGWDSNVLIFAECLGDGDYIAFRFMDNGQYEVLDGFHEEDPENWEAICESFDDFLDKLIDSDGRKYWLK